MESASPDVVVLASSYDPTVSSTYVPTGQNGTVLNNDADFNPTSSTGPLAYEKFAIAGLTVEGQGFLRATSVRDEASFSATNALSFIGWWSD